MPNVLPRSQIHQVQMLGLHPRKFSMLSSQSFHQPDAQVDSFLYNYLSYEENCADLKQQLP